MEREIQLQHDIHNSLDRIRDKLSILDKWNKELSLHKIDPINNPLPNTTVPFVLAEYVRTHIDTTRKALNNYYEEGKKLTK